MVLVPSPEESNVDDGLRTRTLSLDGFPALSHSYLNGRGRGGRGVRGRMVIKVTPITIIATTNIMAKEIYMFVELYEDAKSIMHIPSRLSRICAIPRGFMRCSLKLLGSFFWLLFEWQTAIADLAQRRLFAPRQIKIARKHRRSEERRVGKECRSRWSPYH